MVNSKDNESLQFSFLETNSGQIIPARLHHTLHSHYPLFRHIQQETGGFKEHLSQVPQFPLQKLTGEVES